MVLTRHRVQFLISLAPKRRQHLTSLLPGQGMLKIVPRLGQHAKLQEVIANQNRFTILLLLTRGLPQFCCC